MVTQQLVSYASDPPAVCAVHGFVAASRHILLHEWRKRLAINLVVTGQASSSSLGVMWREVNLCDEASADFKALKALGVMQCSLWCLGVA